MVYGNPLNGVQLRIRGNKCIAVYREKETEPAKESSGSGISVSRLGWLMSFLELLHHRFDQTGDTTPGGYDAGDSWKLAAFLCIQPYIRSLDTLLTH